MWKVIQKKWVVRGSVDSVDSVAILYREEPTAARQTGLVEGAAFISLLQRKSAVPSSCPKTFTLNTVTKINMPGKKATHGSVLMVDWAW